MFKAMKSASMQQEADLVKAGHPGLFQSTPKVTCDDWDCIQVLDVRTLLCTHVVTGSGCEKSKHGARGDGLVQGRETRVMGKVSWRVGRGWMDLQHQWKK